MPQIIREIDRAGIIFNNKIYIMADIIVPTRKPYNDYLLGTIEVSK